MLKKNLLGEHNKIIYMCSYYFVILLHLSKNINFLRKTINVAASSG